MTGTAKSTPSESTPTRSLSEMIGRKSVLPGESQEQYDQALAALVAELQAETPLQVYLAEKMLDCFWWMRRYEDQKRLCLAYEMAETLKHIKLLKFSETKDLDFLDLILYHPENTLFQQVLRKMGFTMETLRERGMIRAREKLLEFDRLIALQSKMLEGFQRSFEHVSHRKLHSERLALSLEMLRRDVRAIEGRVRSKKAIIHDEPTADSG